MATALNCERPAAFDTRQRHALARATIASPRTGNCSGSDKRLGATFLRICALPPLLLALAASLIFCHGCHSGGHEDDLTIFLKLENQKPTETSTHE